MEFLADYGLFLAKTATFVTAFLILLGAGIAVSTKGGDKDKKKLRIKKLNDRYQTMADTLKTAALSKKERKLAHKAEKKQQKLKQKSGDIENRRRIFVVNFNGDIRAHAVEQLRDAITAILTVATPKDEVVICLESGGGVVHGYGLGASQLRRVRDRGIPLTVIIDKVAASGGYMMACVADHIIAAPFAFIGSVGVLVQLPNFHRLLKQKHVDFEQLSAGEFKRTLSLFGENTRQGREKLQQEIDETHDIFKAFVKENRPQLDIDKIATGEHWLGTQALRLNLIDKISTSDDYLLNASETADLYSVEYKAKKKLGDKLAGQANSFMNRILTSWHNETMV
ncbi:MAG: protease SohB [Legionellales bacterium]|nr:protease SohB [Legionellales bacterium]|tara:strand:+ start:50782 stop:51798 length:1017 start_codon:yes stop_codon:yes gene_type:complete